MLPIDGIEIVTDSLCPRNRKDGSPFYFPLGPNTLVVHPDTLEALKQECSKRNMDTFIREGLAWTPRSNRP